MALKMKKLVKAASLPNAKNDFLKDRVEVIQGKLQQQHLRGSIFCWNEQEVTWF